MIKNLENEDNKIKENEFIIYFNNFISSMIDFQVRIQNQLISLDDIQRDEIRKISDDYFNALLKISNRQTEQIETFDVEKNSFPLKNISKDSFNLLYNIDQIIISINYLKSKILLQSDHASQIKQNSLRNKLEDFQKFINETDIYEIIISKLNVCDPSSKITNLTQTVIERELKLDEQLDECKETLAKLTSKIDDFLEKKHIYSKNKNLSEEKISNMPTRQDNFEIISTKYTLKEKLEKPLSKQVTKEKPNGDLSGKKKNVSKINHRSKINSQINSNKKFKEPLEELKKKKKL